MNEIEKKEIEEMAKTLNFNCKVHCNECQSKEYCSAYVNCEGLYNAGYRNCKDKVVLSREEYEKGKQDYNYQIHRALVAEGRADKARKEIAQQFYDLSNECGAGVLFWKKVRELAKHFGVEVE